MKLVLSFSLPAYSKNDKKSFDIEKLVELDRFNYYYLNRLAMSTQAV